MRKQLPWILLTIAMCYGSHRFALSLKPKPLPEDAALVFNEPESFVVPGLTGETDKYQVVILFSLDDCLACLREAPFWGEAAEDLSGFADFTGLTWPGREDEIADFADEYGLNFKIHQNERLTASLVSYLKRNRLQTKTPIKLFINSDKQLVSMEYGIKDPMQHVQFVQRAEHLLTQ